MTETNAPKAHRKLWNDEEYAKKLGPDAHAFFQERAEWMITACATCGGSAEIVVPDDLRNEAFKQQGKITDIKIKVPCDLCWSRTHRLYEFTRIYYLTVPPAYRFAILRTLQPYEGAASVVSMERQQKILDALRANPDKGYAFFGPAHCGKTVWTTSLYAENLWRAWMRDGGWRGRAPLRRISAKKLLDEHTDYAVRRYERDDEGGSVVDEPSVTAERIVKLRQEGRTYRLFLEEIDKVKDTESRRSVLFDIVNTLVEQQGVLVINSNLTYAEFQERFGEDFAWRVGKLCTVVDLFQKEKGE
jgi:hypothetical protein